MAPRSSTATWVQIFGIVLAALVPIGLTVGSWTVTQVMSNTSKVVANSTKLEAIDEAVRQNAEFHRTILTRLEALATQIHNIDKRVPPKIPPDWFEQRVAAIERDIAEIKDMLNSREP